MQYCNYAHAIVLFMRKLILSVCEQISFMFLSLVQKSFFICFPVAKYLRIIVEYVVVICDKKIRIWEVTFHLKSVISLE